MSAATGTSQTATSTTLDAMPAHADTRLRPLATLLVDLLIAMDDQRVLAGGGQSAGYVKAVERLSGAADAAQALDVMDSDDIQHALDSLVHQFGLPQGPGRDEWRARAIDEFTTVLVFG